VASAGAVCGSVRLRALAGGWAGIHGGSLARGRRSSGRSPIARNDLLFGYTTLIGWGYYGEQFLQYVLGVRVTVPYRWLYCGLIVLGATTSVDLVWAWGDLMNGLQIFPNLVGLIGLSGVVVGMLKGDSGRS
jgi:Na+/alanine symporter